MGLQAVKVDRDDTKTLGLILIYAVLGLVLVAVLGLMVRLFLWTAFAAW